MVTRFGDIAEIHYHARPAAVAGIGRGKDRIRSSRLTLAKTFSESSAYAGLAEGCTD